MNQSVNPQLPKSVSVPSGVLWQRVEDQIVLVDVNRGQYHRLDDVGTRMWELLGECSEVQAAYEQLFELYDVDGGTLRGDLAAFIAQLVDAGLLATT